VEHLAANRARVRTAWASRLRSAQDQHPMQARVIRKQAALRRRHLPLRRLLDQASDVLFAVKPCWAMSPLMVSEVLPAARLFDVVIFDEASQIIPADAIPSIMRGHQVVVAGDDHQLPPTNFFRQVGDCDDDAAEDAEDHVTFGAGFESLLDALRPLLRTWPLTWHYRSRDERLVAFSNARIYDGALTTFPGVLRAAIAEHPELEGFFTEEAAAPFFVKNLERVQGDERDAIILSIGYGKHPGGRMRYQWGPLLRDGGERRLNVATTRAKHRLTLVSSFSSQDIDPARVTKPGARLLADYLAYADSGGTAADASGGGDLSPFEPTSGTGSPPAGSPWCRSSESAATGWTSPPPTRTTPAAWCWPSRRTARHTASPAACATVNGCAGNT
jgi:superfamily I DNA and/or RNA helicase